MHAPLRTTYTPLIHLHGNDGPRDEFVVVVDGKMPDPYPHQLIHTHLQQQSSFCQHLGEISVIIETIFPYFLYSFKHSFIHSVLHSAIYLHIHLTIQLSLQPCIHPFNHASIHAFIHSIMHACMHACIH